MGKHLVYLSLVSVALFSPFAFADDDSYTHCFVPKTDKSIANPSDGTFCLEAGTGPKTIDVTVSGSHSAVSLPLKNCRTLDSNLRGSTALLIDNSESLLQTDPQNHRLSVLESAIEDIASRARTESDTSAPDYPRLGVLMYGGRSGTYAVDSNNNVIMDDSLNKKFVEQWCSNGDAYAQADRFPNPNALARWAQQISNGLFISRCEYLPLVSAHIAGDTTSTTPGMARMQQFVSKLGQQPRGATDMRYFFEGAQQSPMLGGVASQVAKHAILITDGLPSIPKLVPQATCEAKDYLAEEPTYTNDAGLSYCIDRQFRLGVKLSNDYLDSQTIYRSINLHTILFIGEDNKAFVDVDDSGSLNPAHFLRQSSAQTGNGKVKYRQVKSADDIKSYIGELYQQMSTNAIQRVAISIDGQTPYQVVSSSAAEEIFYGQLVDLSIGSHTVAVTAYFPNSQVTTSYRVNVHGPSENVAITQPFQCQMAANRSTSTIDGDPVDPSNPKYFTPVGDGVRPLLGANGAPQRVPINADPANNIDLADFRTAKTRNKVATLANMRLQGGLGNCGSVAGSNSDGPSRTGAPWLFWLGMGLCSAILLRRRKQHL